MASHAHSHDGADAHSHDHSHSHGHSHSHAHAHGHSHGLENQGDVRTHFSGEAAQWDKKALTQYMSAQSFACLQRVLGAGLQGLRVMDFGCGTGLLSEHLQPLAASLLGVDPAQGMIDQYAKKIQEKGWANASCVCADVNVTPLPGAGPYDLIVSVMAFHHIDDVPATLRSLKPYLRPGTGRLAIFDLEHTKESEAFHPSSVHHVVLHHGGFTRAQWANWLAEAGYVDTDIREAFTVARPPPEAGEEDLGWDESVDRNHAHPLLLTMASVPA